MSFEILFGIIIVTMLILVGDAQENYTLGEYLVNHAKYLFRKIRQTGMLIKRRVFMLK